MVLNCGFIVSKTIFICVVIEMDFYGSIIAQAVQCLCKFLGDFFEDRFLGFTMYVNLDFLSTDLQ